MAHAAVTDIQQNSIKKQKKPLSFQLQSFSEQGCGRGQSGLGTRFEKKVVTGGIRTTAGLQCYIVKLRWTEPGGNVDHAGVTIS